MRSMEKKDDVEDDDRNHLRIITAGRVPSELTSTSLFVDETDVISGTATSLGFMDMLGVPSFHDYFFNYASSAGSVSLLDLIQQPAPATAPLPSLQVATSFQPPEERWQLETSPSSRAAAAESSEVVNVPTTPNSLSVSCSSTEGGNEEKTEDDEQSQDHQDNKTKNLQLKSKKKNQKRQREPRFAFMTKSEVDHLDDGYRWRKYGQKAVKNSPFPRSYYRCTSGGCGVKKRVERSSDDASVVVTSYEGQHNHVSPATPHGSLGFPPNAAAPIQSSFLRRVNYPFPFRSTLSSSPPTINPPHNSLTNFISAPGSLTSPLLVSSLYEDRKRFGLAQPPSSSTDDTTTASASLTVRDRGLLQDIISPSQTMRDPKQE